MEVSRGNAHVTGVHADFQDHLLVLKQLIFVVCLHKMIVIFSVNDVVGCQNRLHLGQIRGMLGHICRKDHADDSLPEQFELLRGKHVNEVAALFLQRFEVCCCVECLLHRHVVRVDCPLTHGVNVERIVEPVVPDIVADSSRDEG